MAMQRVVGGRTTAPQSQEPRATGKAKKKTVENLDSHHHESQHDVMQKMSMRKEDVWRRESKLIR